MTPEELLLRLEASGDDEAADWLRRLMRERDEYKDGFYAATELAKSYHAAVAAERERCGVLTDDDIAAVNAARKAKAWEKRDLKRCQCDHTEYCQHCFPLEFRPGGVWGGAK